MRQFQEKKKIKAKLYSKPVLIGLVVLSLLCAKAVANIFVKYRESKETLRVTNARLDELMNRKLSLDHDIKNLESDEGVEEELRKKFNVANPGEKMIVVVENEVEEEIEEKEGFFGAIFMGIKNLFN